ncbi:recombinase family protein [Bacillus smithii]|uniref:recombinase family protein n=1 Tax=Bacillus smithii TaxID=1479 RepID=UPI003D1BD3E9
MAIKEKQIKIEEIISDVAIYARKSRGELEEDLIKHKTLMINICKEKNWRYVLYEEIGSGDTIENRPKMKQLLKDLDADLYDAVVVVDYDRLGRGDEEDQGIIKKKLLKNEVFVVECSPFQILNLYNENDMQIVDFKGFLARQEYKMITKRLNRGKKLGARLGNWTNGMAPFPYDYDSNKKRLVINKEKYVVYRDMIDKLFKGYSLNEIAKHLNRQKYPSPRSKFKKQKNAKWHGHTIKNILTSEVHLGRVISNKSSYNKYKKERKEHPKSEWIVVENCHEPCKTEEEHEKILKIIRDNRTTTHSIETEKVTPFTELIKCYNCGSTLHIARRKNGNLSARKCHNCGMQGGDCEFLGDLIKDTFKNFYPNIEKYSEELMNKYNGTDEYEFELQKIEEQIKKKEEVLARMDEAYLSGHWDIEKTKKMSEPVKKEIQSLTEKKAEVVQKINQKPPIDIDDLKIQYLEVIEKLDKKTTDKERNLLYKKLIDKIYWNRNNDDLEVYIELKYSPN